MKYNVVSEDIKMIVEEPLAWSKLEGKKILITGAGGFLASYIVRVLLYLNDNVFNKKLKILAIVRDLEKAESKFVDYGKRDDLLFIVQDITEPFDIDYPVDFIIHAASQASSFHFGNDPVGTLKANTFGTSFLLDIAKKKKVEKFLFFSSGEVYGAIDDKRECVDETYPGNVDFLDVRSCYAESKRMGENMCVCWGYQHHVPVNVIRVGYTYGPGASLSDDRVFTDFVSKVMKNHNLVLNSDGSARRSFCYITDMIAATFLILLEGKNGEVYNVASNIQTSILELAELLIKLYPEKGLHVEFRKVKGSSNYLGSKRKRTLVCTDKVKALGWERRVNIDVGFRRMIESYQD